MKITPKNLISYMKGFDFILKERKTGLVKMKVLTFNPKEAKHYQIKFWIKTDGLVTMNVAIMHNERPDNLIEMIIIEKLSEIEFFLKRLSRPPIYPVRKQLKSPTRQAKKYILDETYKYSASGKRTDKTYWGNEKKKWKKNVHPSELRKFNLESTNKKKDGAARLK